jgi:hypothetical protein
MSDIDKVCEMLAARMEAIRARRATFERMGADDSVRLIESELDIVKSIANEVLAIAAKAGGQP